MKKKSLFLSVILFLTIVLGCMTGCRAIAFQNDPYPEYKELKRVKGDTYSFQGEIYKSSINFPYALLECEMVAKFYGFNGIVPIYASVQDVDNNVLTTNRTDFCKEGFETPQPETLSFDVLYGYDAREYVPVATLHANKEAVAFKQVFVGFQQEYIEGEKSHSIFLLRISEYSYLALPITLCVAEGKIYASMNEYYCRFKGMNSTYCYYQIADEYQETFRNALEWKENIQ